jgi:hypothetical protein
MVSVIWDPVNGLPCTIICMVPAVNVVVGVKSNIGYS